MLTDIAAIFCLAYIVGLLFTGFPGTVAGIPLGAIVLLFSGVAIAFLIRRIWRTAPRAWVWLTAGLIGVVASLYFQIRIPQPSPTDICHWIPDQVAQTGSRSGCESSPQAKVGKAVLQGKVMTAPRLTRSDRLQFELTVTQLQPLQDQPPQTSTPLSSALPHPAPPDSQSVTGRVYVTLPRSAGEQLYPGLPITITGSLYKPKPANNPGGFDFAQYLAQQGIFAGLNGTQLIYPAQAKPAPPLFWRIRQRIVQTQEFGLGSPEGALVSAMVMGKTAVDVPYRIQDQFKQTGLAHALAASGAQVSLLVGVILTLTQRCSSKVRLGLGTGILILYVGLTGIEPSVLRAGIMGFVALVALTAERKVKPLGSLLLTATILLLIDPAWIFDLGFQLSFLATLGLLVTVPVLTKWLDWLPSAITPMFAVPIAAYIWTSPLLLWFTGVVSPYSILVNVLVSPLIAIISIGGMISAVAALVHPAVGSVLAWVLYWPTHLFLKIAEMGSQLPGNIVAVGTITPLQVGLLYGLILLVWQWRRLHAYWWLVMFVGLSLVAVPAGYSAANQSQITVLATTNQPVLVVQAKGRTGLVHAGNPKDVQFTLLPFLQKQGVNQLNWAVAPSLNADETLAWQQIVAAKPIDLFYSSPDSGSTISTAAADQTSSEDPTATPVQQYKSLLSQVKAKQGVALPLSIGHQIQLGSTTIEAINAKPDIFRIQIDQQTWLWFDGVPALNRQPALVQRLGPVDAIGWSGKALSPKLLEQLNPKVAILYGDAIDPKTQQWLSQHHVTLHSIAQQGAIQWQPTGLTTVGSMD